MQLRVASIVVGLGFLAASTALGQATKSKSDCGSGGQCCQAKEAKSAAHCTVGAKAAAGKRLNMPAMQYVVGEKRTQCSDEAAKLAKAGEKTIRFVVADKTFAEEGEAKKAYTKVLDEFLANMTRVQFAVGDECTACPLTAKSIAEKKGAKVRYRLASYTFDDKAKADKIAKLALDAAEKVQLTLAVGTESYQCPVTAKEAAQSAGKKLEYCVGEKRTACQVTAKVELAKAKINAANAVIAKAAGA